MESPDLTEDCCEDLELDVAHDAPRRASLIDDETADRLARTFRALADPTRVRILSVLARGELCVHEVAECLEMTQSAISHQLHTLREMRLVRFRREGRHVYYALDDQHIVSLFTCGLEHVEHE